MSYKNIRIKMKGGKSRTQRVKVLKSGKYKFVKNLGSRVKYTRKVKKTTRRKRNLTRKRKSGKRKFTLPIAPLAGLAAGMVDPITEAIAGRYDNALAYLSSNYTGYHPAYKDWKPERMMNGLVPLVIGCLVHKFVGGPPLNVNRMLAAANVPVIRI